MALLPALFAVCLALGAAAPSAPVFERRPLPALLTRDDSLLLTDNDQFLLPEDADALRQVLHDPRSLRGKRQSAGWTAQNLALSHDDVALGEPVFDGHVNVDEARNTLHFGAGGGTVLSRSDDGQHSLGLGLYGQGTVTGGDSLTFSRPNVGGALGYRYNGDSTSLAAGLHRQDFGRGITEYGGAVNVEHRLNDQHSIFGGASHSVTNYPGPAQQTDTTANLGYRYNLNDRTSLSVGAHRTNSDFGSFGSRNDHGFDFGIRHNF
ncbi:uncharacterized protein [Panulirus ornatus]|uniref:uncharacterized protein isoform X1 n=1 Tax=Panulirus ornatus TaxID=150431 RepID=UPI003A8AD83B